MGDRIRVLAGLLQREGRQQGQQAELKADTEGAEGVGIHEVMGVSAG